MMRPAASLPALGLDWLMPSAVIPFSSAQRLAGGRPRRSEWDHYLPGGSSALIFQPDDAVTLGSVVGGLPLPALHLAVAAWSVRLRLYRAPHRLQLEFDLLGFSAAIVPGADALRIWLLEPDFSLPPPHLGLAAPHIAALLGRGL